MNPNGTISQYCKCPPGTTAPLCELRNPCSPNPCLNGGNCTANGASIGRRYTCQCLRGFSGFNCRNQMQSKCDTGLKTGENGTIAIPRGDLGLYDNNLKCAWVIEVNKTKVINVTFNKFHVEESADCRYDWLQVGGFCFSDELLFHTSGFSLSLSTRNRFTMGVHQQHRASDASAAQHCRKVAISFPPTTISTYGSAPTIARHTVAST